jgi:hypothetical protein
MYRAMMMNSGLLQGGIATSVKIPSAENINKNLEHRYEGVLQEADKADGNLQKKSLIETQKDLQKLDPDLALQGKNSGTTLKVGTEKSVTSDFTTFLASPPAQITMFTMLAIGAIGCSIPIVKAIKRKVDDSSDEREEANENFSNKLEAYLETDFTKGVWWKRPAWGKKTTMQRMLKPFYRKKVPKGILFVHGRELERVAPLAEDAQILDIEKFKSSEFIEFLKIRQQLYNNSGPYEGLENSFRLLNTAIEAKTCFEKIWQIEFRFLSSKQQECYHLVDQLLADNRRGKDFQNPLESKIEKVLPFITSKEGQQAIIAYGNAYIQLSEYEFGLDLMLLFKQYKMSDYVVLVTVDKILRQYQKEDLTDFRTALIPVTNNFDAVEKLGPIIQLSKKKAVPETFARMLQFVAMLSKHEDSYVKFQQLMTTLEEWKVAYQAILDIRHDYSGEVYRQPKEFTQKIPGEKLYEKYQKWFSSSKAQA